MGYRGIGYFIVASIALMLPACIAEMPASSSMEPLTEVSFVAAFAPVTEVTVYDRDGYVVAELTEDFTVLLESGVYFVDMRDDYGISVFSADERLFFAPRVEGAELQLEPYEVPGVDVPLFGIVVGDADPIEHDHGDHDHGVTSEALHTTGPNHRGRLVWEAARAMVGPGSAGSHTWGTADFNSIHNYAGEDTGAWSALRSGLGVTIVSCRNDNDMANYYTPCSLTYGSDSASQYACQGFCPAGTYRGGQCKAFMNLVAYRSGVYHGTGTSFRAFPVDATIDGGGTNYPLSTYATVQAGDLLRRTTSLGNPHAAIVVRIISSTQIVVADSNWVGGSGAERVASHTMGYTGGGTVSDLGTYRALSCVYTGAC